MKNPTTEILLAAIEDRKSGMKAKEILAKHGLSHSQFEFAWLRMVEMKDLVGTEKCDPKTVKRLRASGKSWGVIAVLCDTTEGKVRKTFREATGVKDLGQRIGKGGRWAYGEGDLYEGVFNKPGVTIPLSGFKGREGAREAQDAQRNLLTEDIKTVIAEFKRLTGRKSTNGLTKVEMIRAIIEAEAK